MAVSFINVGTGGGGTSGNASPTLPANWAAEDICILVVVSRDNISHSVSAGWTQYLQANNGTNERLSVWWRRMQAGDTAPTVTHSAGSAIAAQIACFRGCLGKGSGQATSPFDSGSASSITSTTSGTNTVTGITTAQDNGCMVVALWGHGHATNASEARAYSSGGVATTTTTIYRSGSSTTRACVQFAYGVQASLGATGNQVYNVTTVTPSSTYPGNSLLVALRPQNDGAATDTASISDSSTGDASQTYEGAAVDGSGGTISIDQKVQAGASNFATRQLAATLPATDAGGGIIIAIAGADCDSAPSAYSCSGLGLTWLPLWSITGSSQTHFSVGFYAIATGSVSGAVTVSWTQSTGNSYGAVEVVALKGGTFSVGAAGNTASGTNNSPTVNVTADAAGWIVAGGAEWSSVGSFAPDGNSAEFDPEFADSFNTVYWNEYRVVSSSGSYAIGGTLGGASPWVHGGRAVSATGGASATVADSATGSISWSGAATDTASVADSATGQSGTDYNGSATDTASVSDSATGASGTVSGAAVDTATVTDGACGGIPWVTAHSSGRYLVKNDGTPFRIQCEALWNGCCNLTLTEWGTYLDDRASKGINAVRVNLIMPPEGARFTSGGYAITPDGIHQFTTDGDFSTFNSTYGARLAAIVDAAASRGILIIGNAAYTSFDSTTGWINDLVANSNANCQKYGKAIATALKGKTNLIWAFGTDNSPDATLQARLAAVIDGITGIDLGRSDGTDGAGDKYRLIEFQWVSSSSGRGPSTGGTEPPSTGFGSPTGLTSRSTIAPTYQQDTKLFAVSMTRAAYAASSPVLPAYGGDVTYFGKYPGPSPNWDVTIQELSWMAQLSGIAGTAHGDEALWKAPSNWSSQLGSTVAVRAGHMATFFSTYATSWWKLVPSNLGALAGFKVVVTANSDTADGPDNAYVATCDPNGTLAVIYVRSSGTGTRSVSLNLSKFSGSVRGRAFNPTSAAIQALSGSPFTAGSSVSVTVPGDNGTSQNDWTLIFDNVLDGAATDTASVSDSATGAVLVLGAGVDTASVADSASGVASYEGDAEDTASVADSAAGVATHRGASVDTASVADASSGIATHAGASTDSASVADSAAGASAVQGAATDTASVSDSATGVTLLLGASTDTASVTEVAAGVAAHVGAAVDAASATDTSVGSTATTYAGAAIDTASVTDAAVGGAAFVGAAADTAGAADSAAGVSLLLGVSVDTAGAADAASGVVAWVGAGVDSGAVSDVAAGIATHRGASTDAATVADAGAGTWVYPGASTDAANAADTATGAILTLGQGVDSASASDSASGTMVWLGAVADVASVADVSVPTLQWRGGTSDAASVTDASVPTLVYLTGAADVAGVVDSAWAAVPEAFVIRYTEDLQSVSPRGRTVPERNAGLSEVPRGSARLKPPAKKGRD